MKPHPLPKLVQRYTDWHWGEGPTHVVDWPDPAYPADLIEVGRLMEVHFVRKAGDRRRVINVSKKYMNDTHIAFDPTHPKQRLYLLAPRAVRRETRRMFWNPTAKSYRLSELARMTGGRHANSPHADVRVQPVGYLTHVAYLTNKQGDGISAYIHEHGEESGELPILAVDAKGRLWYAGGDYWCPNEGIAN